jgi:hypothetical protein
MTKTFTTVLSHRFAIPRLPAVIQLDAPVDGLFVILNLGPWDLFEIWFLVLVIFMILTKQTIFVKSVDYLFKRRNPGASYPLTEKLLL